MTFWRCSYHLIWTTYNRTPLIIPEIEQLILQTVYDKANILESHVFAVNTVIDHIHIAASIPPKYAVADWVKHVKGAASYKVNNSFPNLEPKFRWQSGYGVLTYGEKQRDFVAHYVERQKEHHANNILYTYLETTTDEA